MNWLREDQSVYLVDSSTNEWIMWNSERCGELYSYISYGYISLSSLDICDSENFKIMLIKWTLNWLFELNIFLVNCLPCIEVFIFCMALGFRVKNGIFCSKIIIPFKRLSLLVAITIAFAAFLSTSKYQKHLWSFVQIFKNLNQILLVKYQG